MELNKNTKDYLNRALEKAAEFTMDDNDHETSANSDKENLGSSARSFYGAGDEGSSEGGGLKSSPTRRFFKSRPPLRTYSKKNPSRQTRPNDIFGTANFPERVSSSPKPSRLAAIEARSLIEGPAIEINSKLDLVTPKIVPSHRIGFPNAGKLPFCVY